MLNTNIVVSGPTEVLSRDYQLVWFPSNFTRGLYKSYLRYSLLPDRVVDEALGSRSVFLVAEYVVIAAPCLLPSIPTIVSYCFEAF